MKRIQSSRWCVIIFQIGLLAGCAASVPPTQQPTVTTPPPSDCLGQIDGRYGLDISLRCSCFSSASPGASWMGLTIGESTLNEVQTELGEQGTPDSSGSKWHFEEHTGKSSRWYEADACFLDGRLSFLEIGLAREPERTVVSQIVEQYDYPDRVTWGTSYQDRALIWPDRGLLIFSVSSDWMNGPIILFPPMPSDTLETSWLMASLPDEALGGIPPTDVAVDTTTEDAYGLQRNMVQEAMSSTTIGMERTALFRGLRWWNIWNCGQPNKQDAEAFFFGVQDKPNLAKIVYVEYESESGEPRVSRVEQLAYDDLHLHNCSQSQP